MKQWTKQTQTEAALGTFERTSQLLSELVSIVTHHTPIQWRVVRQERGCQMVEGQVGKLKLELALMGRVEGVVVSGDHVMRLTPDMAEGLYRLSGFSVDAK